MTFAELKKEIKKEVVMGQSNEMIDEVLRTAIRISIEELMCDPENAVIDIQGVGKFFIHRQGGYDMKRGQKIVYNTLWFKAYPRLRNIIKNKLPLEDFKIAGKFVYPREKKKLKSEKHMREVQIERTPQDWENSESGKKWLAQEKAYKKGLLMQKQELVKLAKLKEAEKKKKAKVENLDNLLPSGDK